MECEGKTSLLYFGGRLSHMVNKRPLDREFRVQEQFGGLFSPLLSPPTDAVALAEQVLATIDEPALYARIDTVPNAEGRWLFMEAEMIEPGFYLGVDPAQGAGFARAMKPLPHDYVGAEVMWHADAGYERKVSLTPLCRFYARASG